MNLQELRDSVGADYNAASDLAHELVGRTGAEDVQLVHLTFADGRKSNHVVRGSGTARAEAIAAKKGAASWKLLARCAADLTKPVVALDEYDMRRLAADQPETVRDLHVAAVVLGQLTKAEAVSNMRELGLGHMLKDAGLD